MKKIYVSSSIEESTVQSQELLTSSPGVTSPGGIGYGGVDTGGSKEPGARYYNKVWDDDEEAWW